MIKFRTLGALGLTGPDGEELQSALAQPKRVALLAYLALAAASGLHRRDKLLGIFWPEMDQEHASAALRQALWFLRRELGNDVVVSRADGDVGLRTEDFWCDAIAFEALLDAGQAYEALDLYRGDLLESFYISGAPEFEHWLDAAQMRLRWRASDAAWELAEESEAEGEGLAAKRWARRAAALTPDDENMLRRLMALLDRVGDRTEALRAFEAFASRLAEEDDLDPSPETQQLIDDIRTRVEPSPEFVTPPRTLPAKTDDDTRRVVAPTDSENSRRSVPWMRIAAILVAAAAGGVADRFLVRQAEVPYVVLVVEDAASREAAYEELSSLDWGWRESGNPYGLWYNQL